MNPTFEWGLDFMQAMQQAVGAVGIDLAQIFTFMGNQEFYLFLFPLLFWCIDGTVGARITILYLLSVVWTDDGLPVGMQFVGRFADEATLFRLAGQLEKAQPWFDKAPPIVGEMQ